VLVSQGLDHVMGPLAKYLGVNWLIANRLEFRDGIATGRLIDRSSGRADCSARLVTEGPDGRRSREQLARDWV